MSLTVGSRLGPYEVLAPLGAGGMGEVFRARDTRLNRDVAMKVLPDLFAKDTERLGRFQREAQMLASLNHPNIAQIHGLEESDGIRALVMEFVEGPTLADTITRGGRLAIGEVLAIGRQLAEALEAAHERGVVHRDLKPANIKVRPDGAVKVLDFGLAKALHAPSGPAPDILDSPTITGLATQVGVILGTAAYMAPEQAKGKSVDKRVDIWAFGCVLFEMLTGHAAFDAETATETVAAVITREPDWSTLPSTVPGHVRQLLERCLQKDPKRRLRDIGDALIDLDSSQTMPSVSHAPTADAGDRRRGSMFWMVVAAAVLAAIGGVAAGRFLRPSSTTAPAPVRFAMELPGPISTSMSPDGSRIAIASGGRLHVRDLDSLTMRDLPGSEDAVMPFWSPDSQTIAYGAKGKLWRLPVGGGAPVPICNLPDGAWDTDAGGAWMADETIVFTNGSSGLFRVPAVGGDPQPIVQADSATELHFHNVAPLPDGRGVLFVTHRKAGVDSIEAWADGKRHLLLRLEGQSVSNPQYSPTGHLLFHRTPLNPGLWAVKFSLDRLATEGQPYIVLAGGTQPSVSRNSHLVYTQDPGPPRGRLVIVDRQGRLLIRVHDDFKALEPLPVFSPDGQRIAVVERTDQGDDLWVYDVQKKTRTRVTVDGAARRPNWGADGRGIFYTNVRSGQGQTVKRVAADGSGRQDDFGPGNTPAASHDGQYVFFARDGDLYYSPLKGDRKPIAFLTTPASEGIPQPSPDGHYVMFSTVGTAFIYSYIRPFPRGDLQWPLSATPTAVPKWSGDSKRVFFASRENVFEVDLTTQPEFGVGVPRMLFSRAPYGAIGNTGFDVSADGQRFVIVEIDPAFSSQRSIGVVVNFKP